MTELEHHRRLLNLTQKELATLVGVTQSRISLLENKIIKISYVTLSMIADIVKFTKDPGKLIEDVQIHSCN